MTLLQFMYRSLRVLLPATALLMLAGCASERVKAEARKAKEHKEEYVDYYPTGSNIPIKIPKDTKTSEAESDETQWEFRDIQRRGQRPESGPLTGIPGAQQENGPK